MGNPWTIAAKDRRGKKVFFSYDPTGGGWSNANEAQAFTLTRANTTLVYLKKPKTKSLRENVTDIHMEPYPYGRLLGQGKSCRRH